MKEKILAVLSGLHPEFDYSQSENFIDEGLIDSFDVVSLIGMLNEEFSIEISGEDVVPENFCNIDTLVNLVNKYIG